jgi:hypothetical protein
MLGRPNFAAFYPNSSDEALPLSVEGPRIWPPPKFIRRSVASLGRRPTPWLPPIAGIARKWAQEIIGLQATVNPSPSWKDRVKDRVSTSSFKMHDTSKFRT